MVIVDSDDEEIEVIKESESDNEKDEESDIELEEEEKKEDPWHYYPKYLDESVFEKLYDEVKDLVSDYMVRAPYTSKLFPSKRMSAVFMDPNIDDWKSGVIKPAENTRKKQQQYYSDVPSVSWHQSPELIKIKEKIEKEFDTKFGYCLVHLYRTGEDLINYHADREGNLSKIFSLSLGAVRKFRFRKKDQTIGFYKEYNLQNGDMVMMEPRCQQEFIHGVPTEKKVKEPRLNLTFRCFQ